VMTRMSRNFCGLPGARPKGSNTCLIITAIWVFVWFAQAILRVVMFIISTSISSQQCTGGVQDYNVDTDTTVIRCPDGTYQTYNTAAQVTYFISYFTHSALGMAFFVYFFFCCLSYTCCHSKKVPNPTWYLWRMRRLLLHLLVSLVHCTYQCRHGWMEWAWLLLAIR
jgi:hypothetical protein